MLLFLADFLAQYYKGFHVFSYLTLRAMLSILTALGIALWFGPWMIERLRTLKYGQAVRTDGPQTHLVKSGTPTMGGVLILAAIGVSTLLWADLRNAYIWIVLGVMVVFGIVGWLDDYLKIVYKDPKGLPAKWKYLGQSIGGLAAAIALYFLAKTPVETTLIFPFFKNLVLPLGVFYIVLTYFVIVGTSNAVNLTDGLDGLAIMPKSWLRADFADCLIFSVALAEHCQEVVTFDQSAKSGSPSIVSQNLIVHFCSLVRQRIVLTVSVAKTRNF